MVLHVNLRNIIMICIVVAVNLVAHAELAAAIQLIIEIVFLQRTPRDSACLLLSALRMLYSSAGKMLGL